MKIQSRKRQWGRQEIREREKFKGIYKRERERRQESRERHTHTHKVREESRERETKANTRIQ